MAGDQPGPVFDNALRWLAADDLAAWMRWLGEPSAAPPERLSESLPGVAHTADLLVAIAPDRYVQVEFVRQGSWDVAARMVEYRGRIMRLHRGVSLTQHVVVLGAGRVPADLDDGPVFTSRVQVTYLREADPARLLTEPALAPLAVLAGPGPTPVRIAQLRDAFALIRATPGAEHRDALATLAAVLGAAHLDLDTIETAGRESGMPITLEGTQVARAIAEAAEARGLERGLEQGLERGLEQGLEQGARAERARFLLTLLHVRFPGADANRLATLAERLAEEPDPRAALERVQSATTVEALDPSR